MNKVGLGIDKHQIIEKKGRQKLGGFPFDLDYQIVAYSDGDIVLHSIASAILGALSLDDLGSYFPENEEVNKNLNSIIILNKCLDLLKEHQAKIINVDITIICEHINFSSVPQTTIENSFKNGKNSSLDIKHLIKQNLQKLLETDCISVKATKFEEDKKMIEVHTIVCIS